MSTQTKGTLIQAALGAVLITLLMLPFQALTPFAPYSAMLILPVLLFFALQAPPRALLGMFLSFACGVGWAGLFMLVKNALPAVPLEIMMGVGVTLIIFSILAVHPILLGKTPFGVVPAVLLGFVESLLVMMVTPLLQDGAAHPNLVVASGHLRLRLPDDPRPAGGAGQAHHQGAREGVEVRSDRRQAEFTDPAYAADPGALTPPS